MARQKAFMELNRSFIQTTETIIRYQQQVSSFSTYFKFKKIPNDLRLCCHSRLIDCNYDNTLKK